MIDKIIVWLITFISTDAAKTVIALSVNKLVESTKDGITRDVATTMIDGIAKSKLNPTTDELFEDVVKLLID